MDEGSLGRMMASSQQNVDQQDEVCDYLQESWHAAVEFGGRVRNA